MPLPEKEMSLAELTEYSQAVYRKLMSKEPNNVEEKIRAEVREEVLNAIRSLEDPKRSGGYQVAIKAAIQKVENVFPEKKDK